MLTRDDIDHLFRPMATAQHLLLAVSGGGDSLALMALVARWRAALASGPQVSVGQVDHGLRPDSAREGLAVAAAAAKLGLACHLLRWEGAKPVTRIEERARAARYHLLVECARRIGADGLVTAHHADDQAETVLLRLAHGSGIGGLAAMAPQRPLEGLVLWRPLLGVSKAELTAECRAADFTSFDDPTNHDIAFDRARLRHLTAARAQLGLTDATLNRLAGRAARAHAALEATTEAFLAQAGLESHKHGFAGPCAVWSAAPEEIMLRALERLLVQINGGASVPLAKLERLSTRLRAALAANETFAASLTGCNVRASVAGMLTIMPAPPRRR